MSSNDAYLTDSLGPDELMQLESVTVLVAPDRPLDLRVLIGAWERHVEKIERDLDLNDADRSAWGAHDLVAALSIRSFVQQGVDLLRDGLSDSATSVLRAVDERFRSYTEHDVTNLVGNVSGRQWLPGQWWWRRIPVRGPVRRELDQIKHRLEPDR